MRLTEAPSLAVVIPAFNAEKYLARAVASVWATGYPNLTIAIVDDGSTDATIPVAERLCAMAPGRCVLYRHPDCANRGVSASRNLAIECTSSQWIAFLDSDDEYLPSRFSGFLHALGKNDDEAFDAIYELADVRSDATDADLQKWWSVAGDSSFGIRERLTGNALLRRLLEGGGWSTGAIVLRRSLLARTGLFDTGKRIAEDCDLWFRMAAAGAIVAGDLSNPVAVYWRHANNNFSYKPDHRVAMVKAMLDGWRWTERTQEHCDRLDVFREMVPKYAIRSIVATREAGRPELAARILALMLRHRRFGFLLRSDVLRQTAALTRRAFRVRG